MSLKGLSPRTIATYVAGVAFYHKIRDWPDPTHDFVVSKLLAGCRRDRQSQDTREPLSLSVLLQAISNLSHTCASQYEAVMFRAAMLCAFFGFMRIGEFAAVSRRRWQDSLLMRQDVHVNDSDLHTVSVVFSFRNSKNNKGGQAQRVRLTQCTDRSLCPVRAMTEFLANRPRSRGPLFCHFDGSPLTQYQFNAMFRKVLSFIDCAESHYSAHSFRIGAATTAAELGVRRTDIQEMGRWRSQAVSSYIRPAVACQMPNV